VMGSGLCLFLGSIMVHAELMLPRVPADGVGV
jgi:hypothetical protein